MSRKIKIPRLVLGALGAAALGASAPALAQDCVTGGAADAACYHFKGSDTLYDVTWMAINQMRGTTALLAGQTAPTAAQQDAAKHLYYDGTGSGNAENAMKASSTGHLGSQSIGPMSRNMRPGTIDGLATPVGNHLSWAPQFQNIVGLDAAVLATRLTGSGSSLSGFIFPTEVNSHASDAPYTQAVTNNAAAPLAWNNPSAFNNAAAGVNYSNLLSVVLAGVDGSGSLAACSDPRRIQALQDFAANMGVSYIEHIYRRDDNSGTTDTFKDKIIVVTALPVLPLNQGDVANGHPGVDPRYWQVGGRFCNGQSIGGINGSTVQTGLCSATRATICKADTDCPATEHCWFNLNNQDFDPIRRKCVAADPAGKANTTCTNMVTGQPCQAGDVNCTQGLIVALTDTDPGSTDITTSIAARVASDTTGQTIGYAGRETVASGRGTKAMKINTFASSDANVNADNYLLSRRLFVQNAINSLDWPGYPAGSPTVAADVTDDGVSPGKGSAQVTAEQNFFSWVSVKSNTDPIVTQYGFVKCAAVGGLCATIPAPRVPAPYGAGIPNGSFGASGAGGTKSIDSKGNYWSGTALAPPTCTYVDPATNNPPSQYCVSTGVACPASGVCPLVAARATNSACSQDSDCASGHCVDGLNLATPGRSLVCQ